ncbi:HypC/HybG/HupF family hydrogenase formation chaperone [Myxococcota bacterium]|nr:HypC/HybG/HupF family hydrogenase formation chaperone [Myxococcota bacterium]
MCLAVPVQVIEKGTQEGLVTVAVDGVSLQVGTALVEKVEMGDWVLVHAGYIIEVYSEEAAMDKLALFEEFYERVRQEDAQRDS